MTKKQRKKDVKMQESPTISFGINKTPRVETSHPRLATMLMKTNGVTGVIDPPAKLPVLPEDMLLAISPNPYAVSQGAIL